MGAGRPTLPIAAPVNSAGISIGTTTRLMVCSRVAPKVAATSSISRPSSLNTGCKVRTVKGNPIKVIATRTPHGV